ncbi:MAG: siderophore-interacting protein [Rhodococcus sp. (in: high G+C Gram-positive bacteria)]|uniref:siderophore-interacting protein n=1 Tax=Rhodococcus sp. TaxID=1831 RepID=UPI003BB74F30
MTTSDSVDDLTEKLVLHDLVPRRLTVLRTVDLTPRMRRIVVGGAQIDRFPHGTGRPTDHVKLFFPDDTGDIAMPGIEDGGRWVEPDGRRLEFRDYTIRAFDPDTGELTLDFVLHEHGVGGRWATTVEVGAPLGVLGPRGSVLVPTGYPAYLLAADETALPALARWLVELPATANIQAFVEVTDADDEIDLEHSAHAQVTYLHRGTAAPGSTELLADAIRAATLPTDPYYVWAAGEAGTLKPIRRYFRRELGLPKHRVDIDGYWKRGVVNLDHHDDEGDDA